MKLKNLFLTSLVALALGACSNASEEATTANSETGTMVFSFGVNTATSRSGEVSGDKNVGTTPESTINKVYVRIVPATGNVITKTFAVSEFNAETTSDSYRYTLKEPISGVPTGAATIYVSVNETNTAEGSVDLKTTYSTLDGLNVTSGIADVTGKNFKMTGTGTATIVAGETVTGKVTVDRVVAKLEERTATTAFAVTTPVNLGKEQTSTPVKVKFVNYTYVNLPQQYNNFSTSTFPTFTYIQACGIKNKANDFNMDNATGANLIGANAKAITGELASDAENYYANKTYCLENVVDAADATISKQTSIVYKAQIQLAGADGIYADYTNNCYVVTKNGKETFYKSFADMDNDNDNVYSRAYGFGEATTYADFAAKGVQKYVKGICYYAKPIQTITPSAVSKIVRNNWYILSVASVSKLGTPVPNPVDPTKEALLDLQILMNPWTYQVNSFNL